MNKKSEKDISAGVQEEMRPRQPLLEFVAALKVNVTPSLVIGQLSGGLREVVPISGGSVQGPGLNGKVLAGGADWSTLRANGTYKVWARYTLQLDDGTMVGIINSGLVRTLSNGQYFGHTIPEFEVADGPHAWLRDSIFLGALSAADSEIDEINLEFWRVC